MRFVIGLFVRVVLIKRLLADRRSGAWDIEGATRRTTERDSARRRRGSHR